MPNRKDTSRINSLIHRAQWIQSAYSHNCSTILEYLKHQLGSRTLNAVVGQVAKCLEHKKVTLDVKILLQHT